MKKRTVKSAVRRTVRTDRVVDLDFYRIKKKLQSEGFEVIPDQNGKLTLVVRIHPG